MKIGTKYNRVEEHMFVLSTHELKEALSAYVSTRAKGYLRLPANAREETDVEFGDCHDEAVTLVSRYIYDPDPVDEAKSGE